MAEYDAMGNVTGPGAEPSQDDKPQQDKPAYNRTPVGRPQRGQFSAPRTAQAAISPPTRDQLREMQGLLKVSGAYNGKVSGDASDPAKAAIEKFQKSCNLDPAKASAEETLAKLRDAVKNDPQAVARMKALAASPDQDNAYAIQYGLKAKGAMITPDGRTTFDGKLDPRTSSALANIELSSSGRVYDPNDPRIIGRAQPATTNASPAAAATATAAAASPSKPKFDPEVKEAQELLRAHGITEVTLKEGEKPKSMLVDGLNGPITSKGLIEFKQKHGIDNNASFAETLKALRETPKPGAAPAAPAPSSPRPSPADAAAPATATPAVAAAEPDEVRRNRLGLSPRVFESLKTSQQEWQAIKTIDKGPSPFERADTTDKERQQRLGLDDINWVALKKENQIWHTKMEAGEGVPPMGPLGAALAAVKPNPAAPVVAGGTQPGPVPAATLSPSTVVAGGGKLEINQDHRESLAMTQREYNQLAERQQQWQTRIDSGAGAARTSPFDAAQNKDRQLQREFNLNDDAWSTLKREQLQWKTDKENGRTPSTREPFESARIQAQSLGAAEPLRYEFNASSRGMDPIARTLAARAEIRAQNIDPDVARVMVAEGRARELTRAGVGEAAMIRQVENETLRADRREQSMARLGNQPDRQAQREDRAEAAADRRAAIQQQRENDRLARTAGVTVSRLLDGNPRNNQQAIGNAIGTGINYLIKNGIPGWRAGGDERTYPQADRQAERAGFAQVAPQGMERDKWERDQISTDWTAMAKRGGTPEQRAEILAEFKPLAATPESAAPAHTDRQNKSTFGLG